MSAAGFDAGVVGRTVRDAASDRIGQVSWLYLDTGVVAFAGVAMIRRGRWRIVFVPLRDATLRPASITVTCGKLPAGRAPSVRPERRSRSVRRRTCSLTMTRPTCRQSRAADGGWFPYIGSGAAFEATGPRGNSPTDVGGRRPPPPAARPSCGGACPRRSVGFCHPHRHTAWAKCPCPG
jgi:hypothetical protein